MATSRARTAPKGRPTPKRNPGSTATAPRRSPSVRVQWTIVAVVLAAVLVALLVIGGGGTGVPVHGG